MCIKEFYIRLLHIYNFVHNKVYLLLRIRPKVKGTIDTLDYILRYHCSVSRYGDGELLIMDGWYIGFQEQNEDLSLRLKEIMKSNAHNHIVCLPNIFNDLSTYTEISARFWKEHLCASLCKWCKFADMDKQYYDALISRFYMDIKDKNYSEQLAEKLKLIWESRDVVIVEGYKSRMGYHNDLFVNARSMQRVLCPAENAFSAYDKILQVITEKVATDKLILIALGPTAAVLAYDLCLSGYQAIDLGHLDVEYEWFKKGAMEKCGIEGKYVNEVGLREVNDFVDDTFQSQIIAIVK